MNKWFYRFCLLIISSIFIIGSSLWYFIYVDAYQGPDYIFSVPQGSSFSRINYALFKQGLITHPSIFYRYSKYNKMTTHFKAGDYLIPRGTTIVQLLEILTGDNQLTIKVTIPEGKNLYEIAQIVDDLHLITYQDFVQTAKNKDFLKTLDPKLSHDSIEGFLYPETYFLPNKITPEQLIKTMYAQFIHTIAPLLNNHSSLSAYELLILASMVEKETGLSIERPTIAGVFYNRLKKKMRLQSDPTTIYGIWETFNGNLKKKDLQEATPYNTYQINGLPPTPVANPGLAAINAVLHPQEHEFLYFVSRNDGSHDFSQHYDDHVNKVNKYQRK